MALFGIWASWFDIVGYLGFDAWDLDFISLTPDYFSLNIKKPTGGAGINQLRRWIIPDHLIT